MKTLAYAAHGPRSPLVPFEFERREPGPHDVDIAIGFAGICHSTYERVVRSDVRYRFVIDIATLASGGKS